MKEENSSQNKEQKINVHAQYIKDLSFESPASPDCFIQSPGQPDVQLEVNVSSKRINETLFEVCLKINANAQAEKKPLFLAEIEYAGLISAEGIADSELHPFMMIEGPRLLFPFARASISNATRDGGFLPLNINPIDFVALYKENLSDGVPKTQKEKRVQKKDKE